MSLSFWKSHFSIEPIPFKIPSLGSTCEAHSPPGLCRPLHTSVCHTLQCTVSTPPTHTHHPHHSPTLHLLLCPYYISLECGPLSVCWGSPAMSSCYVNSLCCINTIVKHLIWGNAVTFCQYPGLANHSFWTKSGLPPIFINNHLLKYSQAHLFTYCLWLLYHYNSRAE